MKWYLYTIAVAILVLNMGCDHFGKCTSGRYAEHEVANSLCLIKLSARISNLGMLYLR